MYCIFQTLMHNLIKDGISDIVAIKNNQTMPKIMQKRETMACDNDIYKIYGS